MWESLFDRQEPGRAGRWQSGERGLGVRSPLEARGSPAEPGFKDAVSQWMWC